MRKGLLVGLGAALAACAVGAADASACSRRSGSCGYYAPPVAYQYGPPPQAYGYGPPPVAYYGPPAAGYGYARPAYGYDYARAPAGYGYAPPAYGYGYARARDSYGAGYYGYRGRRDCDRGDGFTPQVGYDGYRPAAVWVPLR